MLLPRIATCLVFVLVLAVEALALRHVAKMSADTALNGRNLKIKIRDSTICYDIFRAKSGGLDSTVLFLPGLVREKNEGKSVNLQSYCKKEDLTFMTADYFGVGRSEGKFEDGTVTRWTEDTIMLMESVLSRSKSKAVLVGHGLGSWIAFLIASKRPDLVHGVVGISSDPDFTEELLWKQLGDDIKAKIMQDGVYSITWGKETYPITRNLIEDARKNLLLAGGPRSIPVTCPVRLVHALYDEEVPYSFAVKLAENCASKDTAVLLLKTAAHDMEGEVEFKAIRQMIAEVVAAHREGDYDLTSPGSG